MDPLREYTSTAFGYVMALLLPGAAALYTLTFYSTSIDDAFKRFIAKGVGLGLVFVLVLACVALSLLMTPLRSFVFEWLIAQRIVKPKVALESAGFKQLAEKPATLAAFRAVVDEHYRYHQFFGGMTFVLPPLLVGIDIEEWNSMTGCWPLVVVTGEVVLVALTAIAAWNAYRKYVMRGNEILGAK